MNKFLECLGEKGMIDGNAIKSIAFDLPYGKRDLLKLLLGININFPESTGEPSGTVLAIEDSSTMYAIAINIDGTDYIITAP